MFLLTIFWLLFTILRFLSNVHGLLVEFLLSVFGFLSNVYGLIVNFLCSLVVSSLAPFYLGPLRSLLRSLCRKVVDVYVTSRVLYPVDLRVSLHVRFLIGVLERRVNGSVGLAKARDKVSTVVKCMREALSWACGYMVYLFRRFTISTLFRNGLVPRLVSVTLDGGAVGRGLSTFFQDFSLYR